MPALQGTASADHKIPCPGCPTPIRAGDYVIRIDLPSGRRWWHVECRQRVLDDLRDEREEVGAGQPG